ncbi:MAG: tRNA 2-thiouridine(34) synthase MnmA [Elusimicrobia bacterium]|nr:tRNA 2-thiouridine(34) synthase MnmA [Elusimicrobiota bacterium]
MITQIKKSRLHSLNSIRVAVAMSGGVDSSVAAALLQKQGYEVIGLTMQLWPRESITESETSCCGSGAIEDARRVANKLGIPHYVINCRALFEKKVVVNFSSQYLAGKTPNPCIRCNDLIKFDYLLKKARSLEARYLATGHYAQIKYDRKTKRYHLSKAKDAKKDQSYFLYTMTQQQLAQILLPLGIYTKARVRILARDWELATADRPESQEICFIPDNDYRRFLKERIRSDIKKGPVTDTSGKKLGIHQGLPFYTIGQRKGLGLAAVYPLYVKAIDQKRNVLVIAPKPDIYEQNLLADKVNFIAIKELSKPIKAKAKIRSAHKAAACTISPVGQNRVRVEFATGQWAITPGQAVVFYKGNKVLGGGTIIKAVSGR